MKICISANTSWYLWNFRLRLMEALRHNGHDVLAIAPHDEYSGKITDAGFRHIPIAIDRRGTNPVTEFLLIVNYYRIINAEHPDIFLSYTPKPNIYATLAARLCGVTVINNIAGLGFIFGNGGLKAAIVKLLYRAALAGSYRVFFQNRDDLREFVKTRLVTKSKAFLLPGSGVDIGKFAPREKPFEKDHFAFLFMARMLWDKGVGEYLEAARQLAKTHKNVSFQLLGPSDAGNPSGISASTLEEWNREGVITWMGMLDDVRDAIASADCVVLPSYYREGIPRTLLEAASMSKPIITTDEPGCREAILDGVTGFLCKSRDSVDLAEKMKKMLLLPEEERRIMGMRGRQRMLQEFDEIIVIDAYLSEIEKINAVATGKNK